MSPSQAYGGLLARIVPEVLTSLLVVAILLVNWSTMRRQRRILRNLVDLRKAYEDRIDGLASRHDALLGDVARLDGEVQELQGVRTELRRHATSTILHPERADVP